ncbi:MAG: hypothetical protein KDD50_05040 [Bdellovibrionales bacterium]|nr:hypothetical protein [Bdellovibrionales bacterium]
MFHSKLKNYFKEWESHGRTGLSKSKNIELVIKRNQIKKPIYIGDTPGDLKAANEVSIDFLYASYGFQTFDFNPYIASFYEVSRFFCHTPYARLVERYNRRKEYG